MLIYAAVKLSKHLRKALAFELISLGRMLSCTRTNIQVYIQREAALFLRQLERLTGKGNTCFGTAAKPAFGFQTQAEAHISLDNF